MPQPKQFRPRRAGGPPLGAFQAVTEPFPLLIGLLTAVGAGFLHVGGTGRTSEFVLTGSGVLLAYLLPAGAGRGAAVGITLAYLMIEADAGRVDAAHGWQQVFYAAGIFGCVYGATMLRWANVRGEYVLGSGSAQETTGEDRVLEKLAGGRRLTSLEYELERGRRHNHRLTLLLIAPDEIQDVVDRYGPRGAQEICEVVAEAIGNSLRTTDIPLREGPYEFVLLLPETDPAAARLVAERVRLAVSGHRHEFGFGEIVDVSVGIGVAAFPDDAASAVDLLATARVALQHAVELGGNRTVLHTVPADAPAGWGVEPQLVQPYRGY